MNQALGLTLLVLSCAVAPARGQEASEDEEKKNEPQIFVGATTKPDEDNETTFTVAGGYSRDLNSFVAVGGLVDFDFAEDTEILVAAGVELEVGGGVGVIAAPGVHLVPDDDNTFVLRLGVDYTFELSSMTLTPSFYFDIEEFDHVDLVWGLAFGLPF